MKLLIKRSYSQDIYTLYELYFTRSIFASSRESFYAIKTSPIRQKTPMKRTCNVLIGFIEISNSRYIQGKTQAKVQKIQS